MEVVAVVRECPSSTTSDPWARNGHEALLLYILLMSCCLASSELAAVDAVSLKPQQYGTTML